MTMTTPTPAAVADELERHIHWLSRMADLDMEDIAADGGVTVAMVVQQEARTVQLPRLERALTALRAERGDGDALREAEGVFALVERPAIGDPFAIDAVRELGDRIGYGNLMSTASAVWRSKLVKQGIAGGEFVAGPCHSTVTQTLAKIRATLKQEGQSDDD